MKKEIIKSTGGLWYERWDPTVKDPLNRLAICCIQGSGEFVNLSPDKITPDIVSNMVERNGFAQDAANGEELPFIIISPLATGTKQADHTLIAKEIGNVAKSLDVDYRLIGGLSQGGQTTAGLLFQAKTGNELTNKLPSSYLNADVFDGFFMFAGQAPMPTDPCAFPFKYVFMVHATGDTAIKVDNSFTMMRLLNECSKRPDKDKIVSNYYQKWTSPVSYLPKTVDGDPINKLFIIPGGGHSTSWTEAYNWKGPVGTAGYEFRRWIERIAVPKESTEILGKLILKDGRAIAVFDNGVKIGIDGVQL